MTFRKSNLQSGENKLVLTSKRRCRNFQYSAHVLLHLLRKNYLSTYILKSINKTSKKSMFLTLFLLSFFDLPISNSLQSSHCISKNCTNQSDIIAIFGVFTWLWCAKKCEKIASAVYIKMLHILLKILFL